MEYKIIRGENQIGGNIIEISTATTKILLDVGLDLNDEKNTELPAIEGLFESKGYDAVFISHYHSDHMGLAYRIHKDIPIYIGERSFRVVKASDRYKNTQTFAAYGFLHNKRPIMVGDIKITPYSCDHSAMDSYMLFAEWEGDSIFYTGDFRNTGRMTKNYNAFLRGLPKNVGTLICEGTTLSREGYIAETEENLEQKVTDIVKDFEGPIFVLQSSMNIDRIVTMYKAAYNNNRVFLEDLYLAEITEAAGGNVPRPTSFDEVKTFITRKYDKEHDRYKLFQRYGKKRIGIEDISKLRFMMCIRTSMLRYLRSLNKKMPFEQGLLIYSIWSGYKEQEEMNTFLTDCKEMGLTIKTLHIGGHADQNAIRELITHMNAKKVVPIHTQNPNWFSNNAYLAESKL